MKMGAKDTEEERHKGRGTGGLEELKKKTLVDAKRRIET